MRPSTTHACLLVATLGVLATPAASSARFIARRDAGSLLPHAAVDAADDTLAAEPEPGEPIDPGASSRSTTDSADQGRSAEAGVHARTRPIWAAALALFFGSAWLARRKRARSSHAARSR